jgi:hypothetical protein
MKNKFYALLTFFVRFTVLQMIKQKRGIFMLYRIIIYEPLILIKFYFNSLMLRFDYFTCFIGEY